MNSLLTFLNALTPDAREAFAARCGTTVGYLRKVCSTGQKLGESLCINIDRETRGAIRCEELRPDVDWQYIRATDCPGQSCTKEAA